MLAEGDLGQDLMSESGSVALFINGTTRAVLSDNVQSARAFEEELAKAKDSAGLKAAMEARFPNLGMDVALDIGSKVAKGEMKWG